MGGIIVWASVFVTALAIYLLSLVFGEPFVSFDFINRGQRWLPLFALMIGAGVGLIDDLLEVTSSEGGLSLRWRLLVVAALGALLAASPLRRRLERATLRRLAVHRLA